MELRLATDAELTTAYHRDLHSAFPPSELPPLRALRALTHRDVYRPWCLFDGDELAGEAFSYAPAETPGFTMFDYLCVAAERRNGGLGSLLIQKLVEAERGAVLYGEAEIPAYAPDRAMAERRLAFYKRNGARQAGYDVCLFGVPYHVLYWADGPVADDVLCEAHRTAWRVRFPKSVYDRHVLVPWEPSKGDPKLTSWLE